MQKLKLVCWLIAVVLFLSCGQFAKQKKLKVYTTIATTNDTLVRMTREWHRLLRIAVKEKNYSSLRPQRFKIGQFISRRRDSIALIRVNDYSMSLIDSEAAYLDVRATVVSDVYTPFEVFNEFTPAAEIEDQLGTVSDDLVSTIAGSAAIDRSLRAYAQKTGIQVKR